MSALPLFLKRTVIITIVQGANEFMLVRIRPFVVTQIRDYTRSSETERFFPFNLLPLDILLRSDDYVVSTIA